MTNTYQSLKEKLPKMIFLLMTLVSLFSCKENEIEENVVYNFTIRIPAGGNSWIQNSAERTQGLVFDTGVHNWISTEDVVESYFATSQKGDLQVGLVVKVPDGITNLEVSLDGNVTDIQLSNSSYQDIAVTEFKDIPIGYHKLEFRALGKTGAYIADLKEILLGGSATDSKITYIKNTEHFYFGRRGPSDHLNFSIPEEKDLTYFYSEIEVPEGQDKIGSYFTANGFNFGYFGIQVNSETERRVIFSVWSPYSTDDPSEIPEDQKIILLDKGAVVNAGEFGNEGSGGHSHLVYNWKAGTTYKFLLKGEPSVNDSSDYTAWFYAPETGEWQLIASFRRPKTTSYLKRFYSFLENFSPSTGNQEREALYKNQWVYDTSDTWTEVTEAKFTVDATARAGRRLDYSGGSDEEIFFLRNCGFFSDNINPDTLFTRTSSNNKPSIDFEVLDKLLN
ncbi:DUF3472 domain-containing protein [Leeuwenhoekiella palythoae]|nr:DUF3472 domain-containing protein [Leeuwenhoekiella palythoae]